MISDNGVYAFITLGEHMKNIQLLSLVISFLLSPLAYSQNFEFPTLTKQELEDSSKEFLANFTHTSVSGASSLGSIWGVEAGIIGGITDAPKTGKLIQRADSDSDIDKLPHIGLLGRVTVPFGLTFEASLIPNIELDDAEFSQMSLGAQWNFFSLPLVDFAAKAHYSSGSIDFSQTIEGDGNGKIEYDHKTYGLMAMASATALIVEPYAGLGFVKGKSTMDFTASAGNDLFNFTSGRSASVDETSSHIVLGAQVSLLILNFGLEYSNMFDTSRYTGKFSLSF
jgi:hypothetical protein